MVRRWQSRVVPPLLLATQQVLAVGSPSRVATQLQVESVLELDSPVKDFQMAPGQVSFPSVTELVDDLATKGPAFGE